MNTRTGEFAYGGQINGRYLHTRFALVEHTAYSARSTLDGVIRVTKGDVITIPANTPHWFKEIPTQTIAYRP